MEAYPEWEYDMERGCWVQLDRDMITHDHLFPGFVFSKHRPYRVVGKFRKDNVGRSVFFCSNPTLNRRRQTAGSQHGRWN